MLPLFALANAGVALAADVVTSHEPLVLAIALGLLVGKPLGLLAGCALAAWTGIAVKPDAYTWRQLAGAGALAGIAIGLCLAAVHLVSALAGIGITMSLFIAGQAFPGADDFAAAKIAVFAGSVVAATIGVVVLWLPVRGKRAGRDFAATDAAQSGTRV